METMERRVETVNEPHGKRGPSTKLLAAGAVAVAALVVAIVVLSSGGDDTSAAASDLTPLQTAELAWERFEGGDAEGFFALLDPDVVVTNPGRPDTKFFETTEAEDSVRLSLGFYAKAASFDTQCTATGNVVACTLAPVSPLGDKNAAGEPTLVRTSTETFTVEDGIVTLWEQDVAAPSLDERHKAEYISWLEENYPSDHAELVAFGTLIHGDRATAERHRTLIQEWAATQ